MKKINNYRFMIISFIIFALALFFPLTGEDLFYCMVDVASYKDFLNLPHSGILTNLSALILTKFEVIRIILYVILGTSMFLMLKNTVNKKNGVLMFLGFFFFLLMDKEIISSSFVNTTGFVNHFLGSLFLFIFINIISRFKISNMNPFLLILLGFLSTSINPIYSILTFISVFVHMIRCFKERCTKGFLPLLIGMILGIVILVYNNTFIYDGFSHNLIREFIPRIQGANFFTSLVLSAILLFLSIKIFMKDRLVVTTVAMLGVVSFLFTSILSSSYYLIYMTYCAYLASTFYILVHINKSTVFKRKICIYYSFKVLFIILSCIFGGIYEGSLLFISLIDIVLILELYNYLLPSEFLSRSWLLIVVLIGSANVYVYKNIYYKHREMNVYIENKLECTSEDFTIPSIYKNDYIYKYIPTSKEEIDLYLKYYDIDVYKNDRELDLRFRE